MKFYLKSAGKLFAYSHECIYLMSIESFQRNKKMPDPTPIVKCLRKIRKVRICLKR